MIAAAAPAIIAVDVVSAAAGCGSAVVIVTMPVLAANMRLRIVVFMLAPYRKFERNKLSKRVPAM